MPYFEISVLLNVLMIFLSIVLINTLYAHKLIDKSKRNSLILFSIFMPVAGLFLVVFRTKRALEHLSTLFELKK